MNKHLIFAGAGHSHIHSLVNLKKFTEAGISVTVVNRSMYHYYSGMGPGILSGFYSEDDVRFNIKEIVESAGGRFIEAEVSRIIPAEKKIILSDRSELVYDIVSCNTGSEVKRLPVNGDVKNLFPVKPVENLKVIREKILNSGSKIKISVIGGGAAGIEIAANIANLAASGNIGADINIINMGRLLGGFNSSFYSRTLKYLKRMSINIYENDTVEVIDHDRIHFTSGGSIDYDIAVNASGIVPSGIFSDSGISSSPGNGLAVNSYLQSADYPDIFAGGDCISFYPALNHVGVYAVKEGLVLYRNLLAYIHVAPLEEFKPQKDYLSILNTGFRKGIMSWKGYVFSGTLPFYFKYFLDRRFMRKYKKAAGAHL